MGLGKTLQAISFLSYLKVHKKSSGPFCKLRTFFCLIMNFMKCFFLVLDWIHTFVCFLLFIQLFAVVLCPLSVTDGWALEVVKFAPSLEVLRYVGDKEHRRSLRCTMYEHVKEQSSSYKVSLCGFTD
jgi:SNF2 family DNA or RNA helicase